MAERNCRSCRHLERVSALSCVCGLLKDLAVCVRSDYKYWEKKKSDVTYKTNLLKHFPQADITQICRVEIYGGDDDCFGDAKNCDECWDEEYCDEAKEA